MKSVFRYAIGIIAQVAAHVVLWLTPNRPEKSRPSDDGVLLDFGYALKPLWKNLPSLAPSTLDLSIIVPCHNSEKYVGRLLDSALNQQTAYCYEVIAIDDGSVDRTYQILEQYANRYSHLIIHHQDNAGISVARNRGIELARGEYIGFADDDDFLSPDYVETLVKKAKEQAADMVQGSYRVIGPDGSRRTCITPDRVLEADDEASRWQYISGYMWRSVYRKTCFEAIRFPEYFWYEDMIARLALMRSLNRVVLLKDIVYTKCERTDSASVGQESKVVDIRALDQYWLAKSLVEYTRHQLGYSVNDSQYRQLVVEWSNLFWQRTRRLERRVRKTAFHLASAYLHELNYPCTTMTAAEKFQEKALKRGHFIAWELHTIALIAFKRPE